MPMLGARKPLSPRVDQWVRGDTADGEVASQEPTSRLNQPVVVVVGGSRVVQYSQEWGHQQSAQGSGQGMLGT